MRAVTCLALALLAATVGSAGVSAARAQGAPGAGDPPPGTRVRVTRVPDDRFTGTLEPRRGDTIVVRMRDSLRLVPLAAVSRFEVSTGTRRHTGRGALQGLIAGASVGALLGSLDKNECQPGEQFCIYSGRGVSAAFGGVLGGLAGTIAGAVIGSRAREEWRPIVVTGAGVKLGVSLAR